MDIVILLFCIFNSITSIAIIILLWAIAKAVVRIIEQNEIPPTPPQPQRESGLIDVPTRN